VRVVADAQHIAGLDGNTIDLYISRPTEAIAEGVLTPCVLYLHGGAMVTLRADSANYRRFRHLLVAKGGLTCVGVEFRNAAGALGCHPFPAGLDDCMAALAWAHSHLQHLGCSHVLLAGDSGGANLAFASALRAKREGTLVSAVINRCWVMLRARLVVLTVAG
jgi:acetyl esterase